MRKSQSAMIEVNTGCHENTERKQLYSGRESRAGPQEQTKLQAHSSLLRTPCASQAWEAPPDLYPAEVSEGPHHGKKEACHLSDRGAQGRLPYIAFLLSSHLHFRSGYLMTTMKIKICPT
jgi:hypothetical protein